MCFSATASFTAAAILGSAGVVSLKKATDRSQVMFASIPLLFSVQQATEGLLWVSLTNNVYNYLQAPLTYIFLFFAQMLWTTWIPLSILALETDARRKKLLYMISAAGIITSCMLAYRLVFNSVFAQISGHHIEYIIESSKFIVIACSILYTIAIIFPPFVSSVKKMTPLGIAQLAALLVTKLFYEEYLISVWCFLAAGLSVMIISIMQVYQDEQVRFRPRNMSRMDLHPKRYQQH